MPKRKHPQWIKGNRAGKRERRIFRVLVEKQRHELLACKSEVARLNRIIVQDEVLIGRERIAELQKQLRVKK